VEFDLIVGQKHIAGPQTNGGSAPASHDFSDEQQRFRLFTRAARYGNERRGDENHQIKN